jgi:hypothetical protein
MMRRSLCILIILAVAVLCQDDPPGSAHIKFVNSTMEDIRIGVDLYYFAMSRNKNTLFMDQTLSERIGKQFVDQKKLVDDLTSIDNLSGAHNIITENEDRRPYLSFGFSLAIMLNNFVQEKASAFRLGWDRLVELCDKQRDPYRSCLKSALWGIRKIYQEIHTSQEFSGLIAIAPIKETSLRKIVDSLETLLSKCVTLTASLKIEANPENFFPAPQHLYNEKYAKIPPRQESAAPTPQAVPKPPAVARERHDEL